MDETWPQPGEILKVGASASVQFAGNRGLRFRVIRIDAGLTAHTYAGWLWLEGYVLDRHGHARQRRLIFVRRAGLLRLAAVHR
ncbi:hypothetical protein [Mangrovihabitans endophyticus]|uniref:Uncharacterized protein n=1 Tax=Mangrovihabitans endophyticus TaxID=1751298 RepID=A0A8J3C1B2_9ACTN|nr:hypothetical protein [Mangrovihabitans endophyticus]GGK93879.1 hypothetical protein GCM10012284_29850 [Mangrovihabitans endophyticus]